MVGIQSGGDSLYTTGECGTLMSLHMHNAKVGGKRLYGTTILHTTTTTYGVTGIGK